MKMTIKQRYERSHSNGIVYAPSTLPPCWYGNQVDRMNFKKSDRDIELLIDLKSKVQGKKNKLITIAKATF